jgi:predicted dehydrogenase
MSFATIDRRVTYARRFEQASFFGVAGGAWAAARVLGANDRINIGLIGIGTRGGYHLEACLRRQQARADVQVVAVCDVYRKRLGKAAEKAAGAKTYLHHQELLERSDIDAIFIATPDHWHAPITLAAVAAGKDVYVEKPMTHTLEEAREVFHRARESKRVVQVGVQGTSWTRWHKVRELVESGALGQVVAAQGTYSRNDPSGDWNWPIDPEAGPQGAGENYIDWQQWLGAAQPRAFDADRFFRFRKYWDYSGGIATDLHYHIVAPLHLALGNQHPTRVVGMGGLWVYHDGREVPDTFLDSADYPAKYTITVQSSQVNEVGPVTMLRGTKATLLMGDEWEGPQSRQFNHAQIVAEKPYRDEFVRKWGKEEVIIPNLGNEGDDKHVDNFFDCVRSRQEPNCGVSLGYTTMTHIALAVRSYREGRMFHFDPVKGEVS